jgi:hypothetical protein
VPVIIHLLNRRRYKTVNWAAMEFLLRAMRKNRKRMRFEQWLLLLTRCCLLALLGLALARPVGCDPNSSAAMGGRTGMHVFVIDTGLSMNYQPGRPGALTHLEQAKKVAGAIIDKLARGGESVVIITAGHPATGVIGKPTYDLQSARDILNRIPQTYGATDLSDALRMAVDVGRQETNQPNKRLYIFTDATASAWQAPDSAALKTEGAELAKLYQVENFNLSTGPQWNQAVTGLNPSAALVTDKPDFGADFIAEVQGFGRPHEARLQWTLDGKVLPGGGKLTPDAAASNQTESETQMQSVLKTGGAHLVTAALVGEDKLPIDNARSRVVNVVSSLKTLIVEGEPAYNPPEGSNDRPRGGSAENLNAALAALSKAGVSDGFAAPDVISPTQLHDAVLSDYRAVMMCAVREVPEEQADQLARFVRDGGTLMWFVDENTDPENYNRVLIPRHLIPGQLTTIIKAAGDKGFLFDFQPNTHVHPLLHLFEKAQNTGLETSQAYGYWRIEAPMDLQMRVLNWLPAEGSGPVDKTRNPDPAILTTSLGRGHVVFVTTSAAEPWITFTRKPVYTELVNELLRNSVDSGDGWMNLGVGDQMVIPSSYRLTGAPALQDPKDQPIVLEHFTQADATSAWRSPPLTLPGVYKLSTGPASTVPIAVNVPAGASDVHTIDNAAMKAALGGIDMVLSDDQPPLIIDPSEAGSDQGWNVMALVLLLAGFEAYLAMRFGHFKKDSVPNAGLKVA